MNKDDEQKLIEAIRSDERRREQAFKVLYLEYKMKLESWLRKNGASREDAEDVFATAMTSIYKQLQKEDFVLEGRLFSYIFTSIKNAWLRHIKKTKGINYTQPEEIPNELTRFLEVRLMQRDALTFIKKLDERCQFILEQKGLGYKDEEVAPILKIGIQALRNNRRKCRQKLINLLGGKDYYSI